MLDGSMGQFRTSATLAVTGPNDRVWPSESQGMGPCHQGTDSRDATGEDQEDTTESQAARYGWPEPLWWNEAPSQQIEMAVPYKAESYPKI